MRTQTEHPKTSGIVPFKLSLETNISFLNFLFSVGLQNSPRLKSDPCKARWMSGSIQPTPRWGNRNHGRYEDTYKGVS